MSSPTVRIEEPARGGVAGEPKPFGRQLFVFPWFSGLFSTANGWLTVVFRLPQRMSKWFGQVVSHAATFIELFWRGQEQRTIQRDPFCSVWGYSTKNVSGQLESADNRLQHSLAHVLPFMERQGKTFGTAINIGMINHPLRPFAPFVIKNKTRIVVVQNAKNILWLLRSRHKRGLVQMSA